MSTPTARIMNLPDMRVLVTPCSGAEERPIKGFKANQSNSIITVRLMNRGRVLYELQPGLTQHIYYIGFDNFQIRPAFVRRPKKGALKDQDMSDSFRSGNLRVAGSWKQAELVIPPAELLRPGQISFLKARCAGFCLTDEDGAGLRKMNPAEAREAQNIRDKQKENFSRGHPCPVYIQAPDTPTDYATVDEMKPENWVYFRMMMPKMAGRVVPEALVAEARSFLSRYPGDLMLLNFAVTMCLVWCRYVSEPHHGAELAAYTNNNRNKRLLRKVPVPPLAHFLLYSTHFFRFHEFYKLSAYVHIFRYAVEMYNRDMWLSPAFGIDPSHIDESLVKQLYSTMSLQQHDWMEITPPSWDGSRIAIPANRGCRAIRSAATTAALKLPDIHTLGFPTYSNAESYGLHGLPNYRVPSSANQQNSVWGRRDVHVHLDYIESDIMEELSPTFVSEQVSFLPTASLESQDKNWTTVQLWTAPQTSVRKPWPKTSPRNNQAAVLMHNSTNNRVSDQQQQAPSEGPSHQADCLSSQRASPQAMIPGNKSRNATPGEPFSSGDELSPRDLRILQRLLENDLADKKHISPHFRQLKQEIDLWEAGLTKRSVLENIKTAVTATNQAMTKIQDFGLGQKLEEDELSLPFVEPCCDLLGVIYPGSIVGALREISKVNQTLGNSIGDFVRICTTNPPNMLEIRDGIGCLVCSESLMYVSRFRLFMERLAGEDYCAGREAVWTKAFGVSYAAS